MTDYVLSKKIGEEMLQTPSLMSWVCPFLKLEECRVISELHEGDTITIKYEVVQQPRYYAHDFSKYKFNSDVCKPDTYL